MHRLRHDGTAAESSRARLATEAIVSSPETVTSRARGCAMTLDRCSRRQVTGLAYGRTARGCVEAKGRGLETEGRRVPTSSPSHTGRRSTAECSTGRTPASRRWLPPQEPRPGLCCSPQALAGDTSEGAWVCHARAHVANRVDVAATSHRQDLRSRRRNRAPGRATPRHCSARARRKKSVGEHWPQPLLQSSARQRADNSVDLLPVPDHD